jgi:peptide/nickel transport system permease protein
LNVIVLAAGQSKRMKSNLSKVMHSLAGQPMVCHVVDAARALEPARLIVVVGNSMGATAMIVAIFMGLSVSAEEIIKDRKILRYVFRNAMLPQVTGLALAIGTLVGGALVAEIIFSYPGLGTTIFTAVLGGDYPLISATALIITVMVLLTTFAIEILYGFIDPRIKSAQIED